MDIDDRALGALAKAVAVRLGKDGRSLAAAESCTGGWIAKCLTDIPGSSQWFRAGFVVYSNAAKTALLGIPEALVAECGAVSEAVARAMAEGTLRTAAADWAVAVTGIAGPDGGTAEKPVGTVWFAWAVRGAATRSALEYFEGGREAIRRAAVARALEGLLTP
ncbi:MAG: CinA family protein [Gammaproteobacteria bacterium]